MNSVKKFYLISLKNRVNQGVFAIIVSTTLALVEFVGAIAVMPFIYVISQSEVSDSQLSFIKDAYLVLSLDHINFVSFVALLSLFTLVITIVLRAILQFHINNYIEGTRSYLSGALFASIISRNYATFDVVSSNELTKVILSEVDLFVQQVFRPVINMLSYTIFTFIMVGIFLYSEPFLTIISVAFYVVAYAFVHFVIRRPLAKWGVNQDASNTARFDIVTSTLVGIKSVKFYGLETEINDNFKKAAELFSDSWAHLVFLSHLSGYILEALVFSGIIVSAILILEDGGQNLLLLLPQLTFILIGAYKLRPAMQNMYLGVVGFKYGKNSIDNLMNKFSGDTFPAEKGTAKKKPLLNIGNSTLHIRNLSFSYDSCSKKVINCLSGDLPEGSVLGVVGASGAGKTTFLDLLLGLRKPTDGEISFGSLSLGQSMGSLKEIVGYVPQEVYVIDKTLRDNIVYGINKEIDESYYKKVLEISCLTDLDCSLGEMSTLGEGGSRISGGQKQRVGIARALANNPKYLIFDEATSGLDSSMEEKIINQILRHMPSTTLILVTHNMKNLRYVTHVLDFDASPLKINALSRG